MWIMIVVIWNKNCKWWSWSHEKEKEKGKGKGKLYN